MFAPKHLFSNLFPFMNLSPKRKLLFNIWPHRVYFFHLSVHSWPMGILQGPSMYLFSYLYLYLYLCLYFFANNWPMGILLGPPIQTSAPPNTNIRCGWLHNKYKIFSARKISVYLSTNTTTKQNKSNTNTNTNIRWLDNKYRILSKRKISVYFSKKWWYFSAMVQWCE